MVPINRVSATLARHIASPPGRPGLEGSAMFDRYSVSSASFSCRAINGLCRIPIGLVLRAFENAGINIRRNEKAAYSVKPVYRLGRGNTVWFAD
jgi:hypothetical protein